MGKTRRYRPKDGEFKELRGSKKQRTKKRRATNANLTRDIKFATKHRANVNMTQLHASLYMGNELVGNHCCDHTKEFCEQNRGGENCNL